MITLTYIENEFLDNVNNLPDNYFLYEVLHTILIILEQQRNNI